MAIRSGQVPGRGIESVQIVRRSRPREVRMRWLCRVGVVIFLVSCVGVASAREQWTPQEARDWYKARPWLVGCNYAPRTAINQLEMWQADTFDLPTIDRELGWAHDLGFNSIRVFLHDLLWEQDSDGLLKRIDQFLKVAAKHQIGVVFVPFDSVWDPFP